jgi:glutamyl-tRNA reductase
MMARRPRTGGLAGIMPIVCVGINHRTAPVALRERLSFSAGEQRDALARGLLRDVGSRVGITEFALLSTCNRTELYAAAGDVTRRFRDVPAELAPMLARLRGVDPAIFAEHVYAHASTRAVWHLCRVASGLDSMVLGESEILGQVTAAHELAAQEGIAGRVLRAVFQTAVRAGRRARVETGICRTPVSVSSEAVRVMRELGADLGAARVLIVGTGKMGRVAGEALRAHGVRDLRVVSRTAAHAERLSGVLGARALAWHELESAIRDADVVISSTGAPHAVLTAELVRSARSRNGSHRLLLIDIAVPRDVEPAVRDLPGVRVCDLDDLQTRLQGNLEERRREVPAVDEIVEEEVARFEEWRHGAELGPLISQMRTRIEAIRQREVERALKRMGPASDELRAQLEAFSQTLVNQLLHEPTQRLRQETDPDRSDTYARVTRDLFGLPGGCAASAPRRGTA